MIKKASLGITILCLASSASAQWEATAGYSNFSFENGVSLDLGAVILGVGYNVPVHDLVTITPAIRIGYGVKGDKIPWRVGSSENGQPVIHELVAKTEVSQYYGLQIRTQIQTKSSVYLFAAPSYSMLEIKMSPETSALGVDLPAYRSDDWGFGIGAGAGMSFSDLIRAELSYERAKFGDNGDANILSVQLRFIF